MKPLLAALLIFLSTYSFSQPALGYINQYIKGDTAKEVAVIDTLVQKIVKDSASYRRILVEKDARIERAYYLQEKELRVVQASYDSDSTLMIVEWFFYNNKMIYNQQRWLDGATQKLQQTFKMYLKDENLIAWLNTKKGAYDPSSTEFKELGEGLKEYAKQLKDESPK
jgi:hypothetical protein